MGDIGKGSIFAFEGVAEIVAHRGFSAVAPENTWAALEAGLDAGADALEFDLRVSGDGVPVLHHDETLERTTDGAGRVAATAWTSLSGLDAGSWLSPRFAGVGIPRLDDVLRRLGGAAVRSYAEIKPTTRAGDAERVADVVAEVGALDATIFISIEWSLLERVRARHPGAAIGYIVTDPRDARAAIAYAAGDDRALVDFDRTIPLRDPAVAERARADGVPMAVWTVDDPGEADRLLALGIPRITTNQVARLVAWKQRLTRGHESAAD